jgi:DNA-binding NarL/FixJ family response regulator
MRVLLCISNRLFAEASYQFLSKDGFIIPVLEDKDRASRPDIILTDFCRLCSGISHHYPESKILLIDTGLKHEQIIAALASHKLSGVLSTNTDLALFKKALKVVNDGQIWLDNELLKAFMYNVSIIKKGKINLSPKEREIAHLVCQCLTNKEIAVKLSLSEQTVKAHLNRVFKKFNISNRSQLVSFFFKSHVKSLVLKSKENIFEQEF